MRTTADSDPAADARRAAVLGGAVALFAACAVVAHSGNVGHTERWAFRMVNDWPDALEPVLWIFQLAGVLFVPLLVAAVAWRYGHRRLAAMLVVLVPAKLAVEHLVVKQLVHRQRPGFTICQMDASCANFRHVPLYGPSFVSGHAIIAWSVAAVLWPHLPQRWRLAPVATAALNSIARVYLGAHNPLDVVGGAAIGVAIAMAVLLIADRVGTTDRSPKTAPGLGRRGPSVGPADGGPGAATSGSAPSETA